MKFGVLGTGMVGEAISTRLIGLGHEVMMGSRSADNPVALEWVARHASRASAGTFRDAAGFAEIVVNATMGVASLDALKLAGADRLSGKILIDVANPLDPSHGMPPSLAISNTDSLGERIQREFSEAKVVKTLNTINCDVMVDPGLISGDHAVFVSGDDATAKEYVSSLLRAFGWRSVVDLGGISTARGVEMYLPLWIRLWGALGHHHFNIQVVNGRKSV